MKDAFKKGFGAIIGMYCGMLAINAIVELAGSNKSVESEKDIPTEDDFEDEKESN